MLKCVSNGHFLRADHPSGVLYIRISNRDIIHLRRRSFELPSNSALGENAEMENSDSPIDQTPNRVIHLPL